MSYERLIEIAKKAYETYADFTENPYGWEELPAHIQKAWIESTKTVISECERK